MNPTTAGQPELTASHRIGSGIGAFTVNPHAAGCSTLHESLGLTVDAHKLTVNILLSAPAGQEMWPYEKEIVAEQGRLCNNNHKTRARPVRWRPLRGNQIHEEVSLHE